MKTCKAYILGALFSLLVVSQASAQSIVGAWTRGDTSVAGASVVVFLANGYFFLIENVTPGEAPHAFPGFERGTYTWDPVTGAISVTTIQDTNGDAGFSNLNGLAGVSVSVSGDTLTASLPGEEPVPLYRVAGASPIAGAWSDGNVATADSSSVVVFFPNGVYFQAQDGPAGNPSVRDGIEYGTYTWNPTTGALSSSRTPAPYVDTNLQFGLSGISGPLTVTVSADGLTLTGTTGGSSFSFARVGGTTAPPATVDVVEYFNQSLDHYFITWITGEIAILDAGITIKGWVRTGKSFKTYPVAHSGTTPVCRYYIPPDKGDSHFFGRGPVECDATGRKNPSFVLEEPQFMQMFLPILGNCPASTTPIYRVFSNRPDANHRYMTDPAVRDEMVAKHWLAEGDGPDLVVMCAPA